MESLIRFALRLTFALAAAGLLVSATKYMAREVAKFYQHGLISLSDLNKALTGESPNRVKHDNNKKH